MASERVALTDAKIKNARPPKTGEIILWDDHPELPGFGVKVTAAGSRIFIVRAFYPEAARERDRQAGPKKPIQTKRPIGRYPQMTLAKAREKAKAWRQQLAEGIDPTLAERTAREQKAAAEAERRKAEEQAKASTFGAVAEKYIAGRTSYRRAEIDAREIRRALVKEWGKRPIATITPRDVRLLIEKLKARAPYEARNAWTHASLIFQFAVHEELIEVSPCASLNRKMLFKGAKIAPRQRTLNDPEIFALWRAAGRLGPVYGPFYRVLLLTGVRISELAQAQWREFDLEKRLWTIPPERFKSNASHMVPITDDVLAILSTLPRFAGCPFVFTTNGKVAINGFSKAKDALDRQMRLTLRALARQRGEQPPELSRWVSHDLRRVVRTGFSALRVPDHVAELAIGHARTGLPGVYDRHHHLDAIREGFVLWAGRVREIVTGDRPDDNVVAFRRL